MEGVPKGASWIHEIKFDGYRLLGLRAGRSVQLVTRNGNDWTHKFPAISAALSQLVVDRAVLDMEAVVVDDQGKTSFQSLQNAVSEGGEPTSIVAFAFDLLHLNGEDLTRLPLTERKTKLDALLGPSQILRYSSHLVGQGEEMFAKACSAGLEGIISKEASAPYFMGRSKRWLKIKCSLWQEFIIV